MPSQRSSSLETASPAHTPSGQPPGATDAWAITWPLSPGQRLLHGSGSRPAVARYWEQAVWSAFSLARLERAAAAVARRHPLVRSSLHGPDRQNLGGAIASRLVRVSDAADLDEASRRRVLRAECERLCLAADGSLACAWQLHALRTSPDTAVITAGFARVFFDRPSVGRILDDLLDAYLNEKDIAETAPAENLDDFRMFVVAEAQELPPPAPPRIPPGPDLPLLGNPSDAAGAPADRKSIRLAAAIWVDLESQLASVAPDATAEALLATACGVVLAQWSRAPRFSLGIDRNGRAAHRAGPHALGQFARPAAVTIDAAAPHSFVERVRAAQRALDTAVPAPAAAGETASAVRFTLHMARNGAPEEPPARSDRFVFVGAARPGGVLEFHAEVTAAGGLVVHLDTDAARFPPEVIDDLMTSLERWLRLLAAGRDAWQFGPAEQAWELFPPGQRERRRDLNATAAPISDDLLFSGFLRRLAHDPQRPAVITPERTLTYGELYGHAGALAHELHRRGIGRNHLVAIAAEKGWEQVAAALGVSLAGAAYLPVDVEQPAARIERLIARGEARLVVTQARRAAALPQPEGVEVLALDLLPPLAWDAALPPVDIVPEDLAYVIFTSGSTGEPKGVMIDHRGAVNTIEDMNARFGVGPDDRVLALSRLSFDLSVYDIFGLLAAGGTVVLPAPELVRDPAHWVECVLRHRVTIWNTVPALMQLFIDYAAESDASLGDRLRLVWMSGDWIPLTLPERIRAQLPRTRIISLGGATEASIWSILYPIGQVDPHWRSIPYGRPMANQTFHVLHENLAPCPEQVPGELFIGGIGVARGYWKDPDRTRARFFTHPRTGEYLYRTGDLGRVLPDGNIEFLGRTDFQVKIRGFRIELGEIEAALTAHGGVRAAAVVARGTGDADRHLAAYVVPAGAPVVSDAVLREHLRARLPEYMVPAVIVFLQRLPLTENGKVDLKALPHPAALACGATTRPPVAAPATEIEEILLQVWRTILGVHQIGIHDDFFALGGNSLSGTRLIMRLREAFALPVPVQCLFEHPTIHRLAGRIERLLLEDVGAEPDPPPPRDGASPP